MIDSSSSSRSWLITEQRALVLAQEPEQPRLRVDVEVVGRFVEQQHVGAGEQDAGQFDAAALATRQRADRLIEPGVGDAEAGGHRPGLALGGVATVGAERLLGLAVAVDVALDGSSSIAMRSFSMRVISSSIPRPDSTWVTQLRPSSAESIFGSCGR